MRKFVLRPAARLVCRLNRGNRVGQILPLPGIILQEPMGSCRIMPANGQVSLTLPMLSLVDGTSLHPIRKYVIHDARPEGSAVLRCYFFSTLNTARNSTLITGVDTRGIFFFFCHAHNNIFFFHFNFRAQYWCSFFVRLLILAQLIRGG